MKNYICITLLFIGLTSCQNSTQHEPNVLPLSTTEISSDNNWQLKELALSDKMIDLSVDDLLEIQKNTANNKENSAEKMNAFRAAVYRFYKNVYIKDGGLHTDIKSGKEIGLSEDVFQFYYKDLPRFNADIKKLEGYSDEKLQKDINRYLSGIEKI
ncbi:MULTISPECIES: hypothetical protein [Sphingobacterium]|uniref:hypothetical protein n=1 Tax=Sphingobacterium TaxID=28453 RepID=UPI0013DCD9BA|nr:MULTISPECIES: hypothetical protein [unclassified Sphingobacterium]